MQNNRLVPAQLYAVWHVVITLGETPAAMKIHGRWHEVIW